LLQSLRMSRSSFSAVTVSFVGLKIVLVGLPMKISVSYHYSVE